jgi:hypothetical protein
LTVLNADMNALSADQAVANLKMNRRDQQIALAVALGGGYTDSSAATNPLANNSAATIWPAQKSLCIYLIGQI